MKTEIISALISAGATIVSAIITMCSSFVVAVLVYLVFKLVLNNQEAKLDLKIEKAKASLVPAQQDLYLGTSEFVHFLHEYKLSAEDFYIRNSLSIMFHACSQIIENGKIDPNHLGLTPEQFKKYQKIGTGYLSSLYRSIVSQEEFILLTNEYDQKFKDILSKNIIVPEIKSIGTTIFYEIGTSFYSDEMFEFLSRLDKFMEQPQKYSGVYHEIVLSSHNLFKNVASEYEELEKEFYNIFEIG